MGVGLTWEGKRSHTPSSCPGRLLAPCQILAPVKQVTFVYLLLFSSFSDIPGASWIKSYDKSHIKIKKIREGLGSNECQSSVPMWKCLESLVKRSSQEEVNSSRKSCCLCDVLSFPPGGILAAHLVHKRATLALLILSLNISATIEVLG